MHVQEIFLAIEDIYTDELDDPLSRDKIHLKELLNYFELTPHQQRTIQIYLENAGSNDANKSLVFKQRSSHSKRSTVLSQDTSMDWQMGDMEESTSSAIHKTQDFQPKLHEAKQPATLLQPFFGRSVLKFDV